MKAYIKWVLAFVVVFAVAVPMLLKGPDGRPIMSLSDWVPASANVGQVVDQLKTVSDQASNHIGLGDESSPAQGAVSESNASENVLSSQQLGNSPTVLSSSSGKMYKWQDENGKWHFSSQKPMAVAKVSVEDLPDVENVIDTPVTGGENSSTIGLPGFGDAGDLLEKVQQMARDRNN